MQPPTPDWGADIAANYVDLPAGYWWQTLFPALAIASLVIAVNLIARLDRAGAHRNDHSPARSGLRRRPSTAGAAPSRVEPPGRHLPGARPGPASPLRDVSFQIGRGESYGLVGESGSGKSTVALALMRYLPSNGRVSAGTITINGQDLAVDGQAAPARPAGPHGLDGLPGARPGAQPVDPGRAARSPRCSRSPGIRGAEALAAAEEMLREVQIADPGRVMRRTRTSCPAGMAQRVVIAMALAVRPSLLILDEPTTALDATVEAEVLDLVAALRQEFDTSVLFISHNLAVIAKMCDRVGVLYAGELVEEGPAREVFDDPRHPYTVGLLRCIPRRGQRKDHGRLDTIPGFLPGAGRQPWPAASSRRAARSPTSAAASRDAAARSRSSDRAHLALLTSTSRRRACPEPPRLGRARWRGDGERRPAGDPPRGVSKTFHVRGESPGPGRRRPRSCSAARRSGWSASRAAARPPSPASCSG